MAIVNKWSGLAQYSPDRGTGNNGQGLGNEVPTYSTKLGFPENTANADATFGEPVTQNINAYNVADATTVVNSYLVDTGTVTSATSFTANEQMLFQNLVTETIYINGLSVRYCPRWSPYTDRVWNERPESMFDKGLMMDMMLTSATGFEGEGDVMTQYGIEFREEIIVTLSMSRFEELYQKYDSDLRRQKSNEYAKMFERVRPLEGDLLIVPFGRSAQNKRQYAPKVFEILRVTNFQDGPFFQLGSNYQYKLRARLFELSFEDINFNPIVVEYNPDGTQRTYIDSDTGKITRSVEGIDVIDSDTKALNIAKDSDLFSDSWASNVDIEKEAQVKATHSSSNIEQAPVLVKDYSAKIWGGSVINSLDDI